MASNPDPTPPTAWRLSDRAAVPLARPVLLGILNLTPDSFYDGGRLPTAEHAARAARAMADAGADALDLGAESTRPGALRVTAQEQLAGLIPAIVAIRGLRGGHLPLTVDTTPVEVAEAALDAGADALNDVSAGEESGDEMLALAARRGCGIILMHRLRPPGEASYSDAYRARPQYRDVVAEVAGYLRGRVERALAAGVRREGIVVDPGLGFGKTVEQNMALIARTGEIAALGFPVLSALSRKSFVGRVSLNRESTPPERLPGTLGLSVTHLRTGASVFRVHDVPEHRAALDAAAAVPGRNESPSA